MFTFSKKGTTVSDNIAAARRRILRASLGAPDLDRVTGGGARFSPIGAAAEIMKHGMAEDAYGQKCAVDVAAGAAEGGLEGGGWGAGIGAVRGAATSPDCIHYGSDLLDSMQPEHAPDAPPVDVPPPSQEDWSTAFGPDEGQQSVDPPDAGTLNDALDHGQDSTPIPGTEVSGSDSVDTGGYVDDASYDPVSSAAESSSASDAGWSSSDFNDAQVNDGGDVTTSGYDTGGADAGSYDTSSYDTSSYDTSGTDAGSYDTGGFDSSGADAGSYDTSSYA